MTKDCEFLMRVCKAAAEIITDEFVVHAKDDKGDLVTNFDFEVEKFIIAEIKKEYPGFDIISEELNPTGKLTENCFTVDPIDGTINFAHGLPLWGIQVACVRGGKTVAAVIYLPKLNEMYCADKNGAFCNGKKISVNNLAPEKGLFAGIKPAEHPNRNCNRQIYCAALCFSWVAAGRLGAAFIAICPAWDVVPGKYLVEQAGGFGEIISAGFTVANSKKYLEFIKKECIK